MVPMGPSEYTVASDSEKPANALTILLKFIIRDKRVGKWSEDSRRDGEDQRCGQRFISS